MKTLNLDLQAAGAKRLLQLNAIGEFRNNAHESARIYKDRAKQRHDRHTMRREFEVGKKVLLFNSRLRLFPRKLHSRWSGPFIVNHVFPHGAVEVQHPTNGTFKVHGQRLKPYVDGGIDDERVSILLDKPK